MWLLCPADLVSCNVPIHLQEYLIAPIIELICLVLIFFDEIVKLLNVALTLFLRFFNLKKAFFPQFLDFFVQALDSVLYYQFRQLSVSLSLSAQNIRMHCFTLVYNFSLYI